MTETANGRIEETPVEVQPRTGPGQMVTAPTVSLFIAAVAGSVLLAYFFAS